MHADDLPVLPSRLQRLAEELADVGVPALDGAPDPVSALVELADALRPQLHEGRVPSYGVLMTTGLAAFEHVRRRGPDTAELIDVTDLDTQFARRFADGVTSFAVRSSDVITHIAGFGRNMADEYDLVGLQGELGGLIIQRHPGGQVRVFGPRGVVRWNGITWQHDAPIDAWIARLDARRPSDRRRRPVRRTHRLRPAFGSAARRRVRVTPLRRSRPAARRRPPARARDRRTWTPGS